jgi:hypothetical protein
MNRLPSHISLVSRSLGYLIICLSGTQLVWHVAVQAQCDSDCAVNQACAGTDKTCPACDAGIGISCSDNQAVVYGGNNIIKRIDGNRKATFQANVLCMKTTQCANGSTWWPFACLIGNCSFTGALPPTYCTQCEPTGAVITMNAAHYVCSDCGG